MIQTKKQYINKMSTYLFTHKAIDCVGCSVCMKICAHSAITMAEDSEGFLYPKVDTEKCVDCGLCQKLCPLENNTEITDENKHAYIVVNAEETYFGKSATVGVCTMLAHFVINHGGIVYGVELNENNWTASHKCADSLERWDSLRNSKYLQSDTKDSFSEVKRHLKSGRFVMYVGTGCQIAGLRSYLRYDYDNLLTVDLICHGVFSHKMMKKEVEYWERIYEGKLSNFHFRNKKLTTGGVVDFDIQKHGRIKHYTHFAQFSPVYRLFTAHGDGLSYNLRPSCYSCQFRGKGRYGDITLGDPWGTRNLYPHLNTPELTKNGIGMVIVNTIKGQKHIDSVKLCAQFNEIKVDDVYKQPALIPQDERIPQERSVFYNSLDMEDLGELVERELHIDFVSLRRNYLIKKKYDQIKKIIKNTLKTIYQ